jgi:hypothetical protein
MNPSFDFVLGKPVGDGFGRWVEGSVVGGALTYRFTANLNFRDPAFTGSHRVGLVIDRPFAACDFAAYLRLVSTGRFETANRTLGLYETNGLGSDEASAIFQAAAPWIEPWEHDSLLLLGELASLGEQLKDVRKKELLCLAIANFPDAINWRPVSREDDPR